MSYCMSMFETWRFFSKTRAYNASALFRTILTSTYTTRSECIPTFNDNNSTIAKTIPMATVFFSMTIREHHNGSKPLSDDIKVNIDMDGMT